MHTRAECPATYLRPPTLDAALAALARTPELCPLAGGTDLYPATTAATLAGPVLDLAGIATLGGVTREASGDLRIGAMTRWADLAAAPLPAACRALQQAAERIGAVQVQVQGTIGGNLCNASPAADGVPPLLVLAAEVELASRRGTRRLPLAAFLLGPRRTARAPDELLTAVLLPAAALCGVSAFCKLGARAHLVISIVSAAARLRLERGRVAEVALAVGAAGPVPTRLPALEAALLGAGVEELAQRIVPALIAPALSPRDDHRASAAYRSEAAAELLRRALRDCLAGGSLP